MNEHEARDYWASMTHGEKLLFVASKGSAASFAYSRLQLHREAARMQMERIQEVIARSKSKVPEPLASATQNEKREYMREGTHRMHPVLMEIHFYFVSWSGCRNMLQILVGQPEFLEAKRIFDGYRKYFEHYVAGRNSFEHFHDRLPGQTEAHRVKEIQPDAKAGPRRVYSGFFAGKYIHSNLEWDISPTSLAQLEKYITDILYVLNLQIDDALRRKSMSA